MLSKIKKQNKDYIDGEIDVRRKQYIKMGKDCYRYYRNNYIFLKNPSLYSYQKLNNYMKKKFLDWIMKYSQAKCCWCSITSSNAIYLLSRIFNIKYNNLLIVRIESYEGIVYKRAEDYRKPKNLICDGQCGNSHYSNAEIEFDFHSILIYSKVNLNNKNFDFNNCIVFDINDGSPSLLGLNIREYLNLCFPYNQKMIIKIKQFSEKNLESKIVKRINLDIKEIY